MKALYAGSFNPWHNGHQYVYDLACKMFGEEDVVVGIGENKNKDIGNFQKQSEFLKWTMNPVIKNIQIYNGLTANFCKNNNIDIIVRGIRPGKSLEYEEDIMYWNKKLGNVDTVFIPTPPNLNQLSSSVIRELHSFGENILEFGNELVLERWKRKIVPSQTIFFGKTCSGKSTIIPRILENDYHVRYDANRVLNCDIKIWEYLENNLGTETITWTKKYLKTLFDNGAFDRFNSLVAYTMDRNVNYEEFLSGSWEQKCYEFVDFANFGSFDIPNKILAQYQIVEIKTSDENREKFCLKKGWNIEKMRKLDIIYKEPKFKDNKIVIQ